MGKKRGKKASGRGPGTPLKTQQAGKCEARKIGEVCKVYEGPFSVGPTEKHSQVGGQTFKEKKMVAGP